MIYLAHVALCYTDIGSTVDVLNDQLIDDLYDLYDLYDQYRDLSDV